MKICCKELSKIAQSGHTAGKLTVTKGATPSSFLAMIVIANIFVLSGTHNACLLTSGIIYSSEEVK